MAGKYLSFVSRMSRTISSGFILILVIIELSTLSQICHGGDLEDEVQQLRAMLEANRQKLEKDPPTSFSNII